MLCRFLHEGRPAVGRRTPEGVVPLAAATLAEALRDAPPAAGAPVADPVLLAPIDRQEVWGAGVTYAQSRAARVAEARGDASGFYADVYDAPRPELFFKATPERVVAPGAPIGMRSDSAWTVPEPELALWLDADLSVLGYGLANDMTARDIEAANPLYLPQAKIHAACCALGPVVVAGAPPALELELTIRRGATTLFRGRRSTSDLHRPVATLVEHLGRHDAFPYGAVLLTGTGIVPPDDVRLRHGDEIEIAAAGLGVLRNTVMALR